MRRALMILLVLCMILVPNLALASDNTVSVFNENLVLITSRYYRNIMQLETDDYSLAYQHVNYRKNVVLRMGESMRPVADGGRRSVKGTFSVGAGVGTSDPGLWYFTFTFVLGQNSDQTIVANTYAMVLGAIEAANYLRDLENDAQIATDEMEEMIRASGLEIMAQDYYSEADQEDALEITDALLGAQNSIGVEKDGILMFMRPLNSTMMIVGVSSVDFFDDFYKGTLEEYIVLD